VQNREKNLDIEFLRAVAILITLFQRAEVLVYWRDSVCLLPWPFLLARSASERRLWIRRVRRAAC